MRECTAPPSCHPCRDVGRTCSRRHHRSESRVLPVYGAPEKKMIDPPQPSLGHLAGGSLPKDRERGYERWSQNSPFGGLRRAGRHVLVIEAHITPMLPCR